MDRTAWRKEKRRMSEHRMSNLFAPIYDQQWGASISETHVRFISKFLDCLPRRGRVLDAGCGTGKYWPLILPKGFSILGIDQAQGMLDKAVAKFPTVPVEKLGLQEMSFSEEFDGVICVDAMEYVFPEDWLLVLQNFHRALKAEGYLYMTVEVADPQEIARHFQTGLDLGLPVVYGESAYDEGYHYYPDMDKVKDWCKTAGFRILEQTEGDEYQHFLAKKI